MMVLDCTYVVPYAALACRVLPFDHPRGGHPDDHRHMASTLERVLRPLEQHCHWPGPVSPRDSIPAGSIAELRVEEVAAGRRTLKARASATGRELRASGTDVLVGMFLSNIVMYFIILTNAATLYLHGLRHIGTAAQAAEALRPLAGDRAYLLFALGIIGTGMLGVPALAGACAYAVAEAAAWHGSLDDVPVGLSRPCLGWRCCWVLPSILPASMPWRCCSGPPWSTATSPHR